MLKQSVLVDTVGAAIPELRLHVLLPALPDGSFQIRVLILLPLSPECAHALPLSDNPLACVVAAHKTTQCSASRVAESR